MDERELDTAIRKEAKRLGIRYFRFDEKRRIGRGWPDLTLIGSGGALFRELKTRYADLSGDPWDVTSDQLAVGRAMRAAGLDWDIWRPVDLHTRRVHRELEAIASPP
jgi:hypothetical protein